MAINAAYPPAAGEAFTTIVAHASILIQVVKAKAANDALNKASSHRLCASRSASTVADVRTVRKQRAGGEDGRLDLNRLYRVRCNGCSCLFLRIFLLCPESSRQTWHHQSERGRKFRDSLIKVPAQLIGGAIVVAPIAWTIVSGVLTLRQTADQTANEQFFNAAQLAVKSDEDLTTAANYAFQKLVLADPTYCTIVTRILTNQITKNTNKLDSQQNVSTQPHVGENISAAVIVLGAIPPCTQDRKIRLTDQYLAGAHFGNSKYFQGADLRNTKLWGAYLGWASLNDAKFDGAGMADEDAVGGRPNLLQKEKNSNWKYDRYNFIVNFEHSTMHGASFLDTSVSGASFVDADLDGADFTDTNISRADFSGAQNLDKIVWKNSEQKALAACYFDGEEPKGLGQTLLATLRHPC
jgi:uncharacterized protein YjbI with pentapeptide repeats